MTDSDTLYTKFQNSARASKDKTAITFYGKKLTYKALLGYVDAFAEGLKGIGVKPRDTVSICLPNTPSAVIAFYAINKLGAIINLIHPYATVSQLNRNMRAVESKLLIAYDLFIENNRQEIDSDVTVIRSDNSEFMGFAGKVYYKVTNATRPWLDVIKFTALLKQPESEIEPYQLSDDEPAVYLPSGGTTGEPKIIMHNCRVFNELAGKAQFFLSGDIREYKAMYSVLPIFHGFGLCMNMHLSVISGVNNVMCIKFDPVHMVKSIKREEVAVLTGVPAMYIKLLDSKEFRRADLSSLRDCFVGGDSASNSLIEEFNALLKRQGSSSSLYIGYGLTETVTVCGVTSSQYYKRSSIGYPLPDTKFAIIKNNEFLKSGEVGEICISTPIRMLGYYKCDESPIKRVGGEDWLFTGDYGYLDEDGYLYFKQRIKNTIKVNGVPIFPSEIEAVIEKIEGVKRVVAIGEADSEKGEVVKVIIEPEPNMEPTRLKAQVIEACHKELIVYAQPRKIEFREELPLNAIGKIDRSKL